MSGTVKSTVMSNIKKIPYVEINKNDIPDMNSANNNVVI